MNYKPKKVMCATCTHGGDDNCASLDFSSMRSIEVKGDVTFVSCSSYDRLPVQMMRMYDIQALYDAWNEEGTPIRREL